MSSQLIRISPQDWNKNQTDAQVSIVLTDKSVIAGYIFKSENNTIQFRNMRRKKVVIPFEEIEEIVFTK